MTVISWGMGRTHGKRNSGDIVLELQNICSELNSQLGGRHLGQVSSFAEVRAAMPTVASERISVGRLEPSHF